MTVADLPAFAITVVDRPAVTTAAELALMPEASRYELVDGHLLETHMSVGAVRIASNIHVALWTEADRTGEAIAYADGLQYQCFPDDPDRVRKPDVSVIRAGRATDVTDEQPYMTVPADLAVEVVSPADRSYAVAHKVREYLDAGFGLVWVVQPPDKTVTVYRPGERPTILSAGQVITAEPALAEFRCDVARFFK